MLNLLATYNKIIDITGLSAIGIFCLCYSLFWSNFAELHIRLPFLNFPIFIGEILLFFCIVLLVFKWKLTAFKFNYRYYLLSAYLVWMLIKALWGYHKFGPLSFRNAALFYYPFFAVVGYHFYQREYFNQKVLISLLLIFAIAQITAGFSFLVFLPISMLFLVVALKVRKKWIKYPACVALFYLFPFKDFFQLNRSMLIANIVVFLFLAFSFIFGIAKMKKRYKVFILFLMLGFLSFGFLRLTPTEKMKSLTTPDFLIKQFRQYNEVFQKERKHFKPREIAAQLYNPNVNSASVLFKKDSPVISLVELKEIQRKNRILVMEGELDESVANNLKDKQEYIKAEAEKLNEPAITVETTTEAKPAATVEIKAEIAPVAKPTTNIDTKPAATVETKAEITPVANLTPNIEAKPVARALPSFQPQERLTSFSQEGVKLIGNISIELGALLDKYKEKLVKEFEISMQEGTDKAIYDEQVENISRNYRELLQKNYEIAKEKISTFTIRVPKEEMSYWKKRLDIVIQGVQTSIEEQREIALSRTLDFQMASMVSLRSLDTEYGNILFRLFIWRDMFDELMRERPWFGFSFGKPQRSISLEILNKGQGEWGRDGWITPHNSFLHIIYRAGILGILMVMGIFVSMSYLAIKFIKLKSPIGLLLFGVLLYWVVVANFAVVLELPYQAIPFWSLWGITFAYAKQIG